MSNEICLKSGLESISGEQQIDEIPNDENNFYNGKSKLLINETKEFIPKSYYESKVIFKNSDPKKGELEDFLKYEKENLNRIQTFNYDKLSESNRIEVKMIERPLLNQEELHCKRSIISYAFETENSLKGDGNSDFQLNGIQSKNNNKYADKDNNNIDSSSNFILKGDGNSESKKNLIAGSEKNNAVININKDNFCFDGFSYQTNTANNNSLLNNARDDKFNNQNFSNFNENKNYNNNYNHNQNAINNNDKINSKTDNYNEQLDTENYNKHATYNQKNTSSPLREEDIVLVGKEKKALSSSSMKNPEMNKKFNSHVFLGTSNNPIMHNFKINDENNNNNINPKNLGGADALNKIEANLRRKNFGKELDPNYPSRGLSNDDLTPQKFKSSINQNINLNFKILNMDNLNVQKMIENNDTPIENNVITEDYKENIIIHSKLDSKKNGSSNGLLDELPSDERDNINLKSAFNLNTNYNEVNTSNNLHKNEIDLIAYNSGNMGEIRPKRYNKNNIEKGKQFFKERYIRIKYSEHLKKNCEKNISNADVNKTDDKHIIKLNRLYILKLEKAIFSFNLKLFQDSFTQLKNSGIILDEEEFAEILLVSSGFDKFMIGDFLAKEKEPNLKGKILWLFMEKIDFQNREFLDAIRFLLSRINMPQDSTLILGILDVFTQVYYKENQKKFKDSNTIYLLASTILAINTLFHKNMANMPSLKKEDFVKMNKDVDPLMLEQIYEEVKVNKLDFTYEYSNQFYRRICFNTTTNDLIISSDAHNLRELISNAPTITRNEKNIKTEEILKMLKKGEIFIKYGNKGKPHPRLVQLSQDEKKLIWRKVTGCNIFCKARSINLADIRDVYFGISSSKVFEKYNLPPQDDSLCFSISTDGRTLDLRKDDENICKKWFNGLKFLTKKFRSMKELKQNKNFVNDIKKRQEFIGDIWKSEIIPNWSIYRDFIIPASKYKNELLKESNQSSNNVVPKRNKDNFLNSIYFRLSELLRRSKENANNKRIIEEKDRAEFFYFISLGIPDWLRKKLWPLIIGNESSINENIFNFYLKQVEQVNFYEISHNIEEKFKQETFAKTKSKNVYLKKASTNMIDFDKSVKKFQVNFSLEPLLNELIIDIFNISRKYAKEIELNGIEKLTLQKELFQIIRVFCMSRPDVTYSKQITYISLILYLNSENFYTAFVNLSNIMISSYLIKFLTNDELFIKSRLDFFERLLNKYHKQVYEHFTKIEISTSLYFYNWMEYLFIKFFKYDTLLRVWDIYLLKGERFLFELALAVIKIQEKDLKNYSVTEVLHSLKRFNHKLNEEEFFDVLQEIDLSEDYNTYIYEINLASEKGALLQTFMSEWL